MYIYTYIFLIRHTVLIGILFYCSILNFNFFPFYFTDTLTFHFLNSFPSSLLVKVLLFSFSLLACSDLRLGFFSCHAFLYVYFELWIALVKTLGPLLCFIVTFFFFTDEFQPCCIFPKCLKFSFITVNFKHLLSFYIQYFMFSKIFLKVELIPFHHLACELFSGCRGFKYPASILSVPSSL